jgi:hypothetical protein
MKTFFLRVSSEEETPLVYIGVLPAAHPFAKEDETERSSPRGEEKSANNAKKPLTLRRSVEEVGNFSFLIA